MLVCVGTQCVQYPTWKTPDLRVRPTGSASGGARAPRYGQLASRSVFNTPSLFTVFFLRLCLSLRVRVFQPLALPWRENAHVWPRDQGSLLRRLAALPPRLQDQAGEPAVGRPKPRHAKDGAAMPAGSLASNALEGGVKERNITPRAYRFGLGQLFRARVRPMAGNSPSGYRQSGRSIRPCFPRRQYRVWPRVCWPRSTDPLFIIHDHVYSLVAHARSMAHK